VAAKVGCHAETLRLWLRDAECDDGPAHEEQARIKGNWPAGTAFCRARRSATLRR